MLKKIKNSIRFIHFLRLIRMCACFPAHIVFHLFRIIGICLWPFGSFLWMGYLGYFVYLDICEKAWCGIAQQVGIMLGLGFMVSVISGTGSLISAMICKMTYAASSIYSYDDTVFATEKRYMRLQKEQKYKNEEK